MSLAPPNLRMKALEAKVVVLGKEGKGPATTPFSPPRRVRKKTVQVDNCPISPNEDVHGILLSIWTNVGGVIIYIFG